jgi:ABC-type branched-subunit amino acid transport system ATPase component
MADKPILRISNLAKHYGAIKAVDDISLVVNPGEIVGLLGPNGAGKTEMVKFF